MAPILILRDVGIRYRQRDGRSRTIFEHVNITLSAGEQLLVVGPSGSGKSTLINYIAGFIRKRPPLRGWNKWFRFTRPSDYEVTGDILIDGVDVSHIDTRRRQIGLVMHGPTLHPHKTALENIAFPLDVQGVSGKTGDERARSASERASFPSHRLSAEPKELSAGEAQRAVIARLLARQPKVALLDEPFAHLDPTLRRKLGREVRQALFSSGDPACMISVTHDWDDLQEDEISPKRVLIFSPIDDARSEHRICSIDAARSALNVANVIDFARTEVVAQ